MQKKVKSTLRFSVKHLKPIQKKSNVHSILFNTLSLMQLFKEMHLQKAFSALKFPLSLQALTPYIKNEI